MKANILFLIFLMLSACGQQLVKFPYPTTPVVVVTPPPVIVVTPPPPPPPVLIAPTVLSVVPLDTAIGVALNTSVTATFSMSMDSLVITTPGTFTITDSLDVPVNGVVTYDSLTNIAIFTPNVPLAAATTYVATISVDAISSEGLALENSYVWSFSTGAILDTLAPTVISNIPLLAAINVPVNTNITATFSEAMNPLSMVSANMLVVGPTGTVTGLVTYDPLTLTLKLVPTVSLDNNALYTVTIKGVTGVEDLAANFMLVDYVWTFTTAPLIGPVIVINLGSASTYGIAATAGVTNTPTVPITHINGDVVLNPLATCNAVAVDNVGGFGLCGVAPPTISGVVTTPTYPDTTTANAVKADLLAAFLSITPPAGPPAVGSLAGGTPLASPTTMGAPTGSAQVLGSNYFTPGVYISITSMLITGDITLDGQGDPNAIFIFQSASTLGTADGSPLIHSRVLLVNGAKASNVWWQVATSATLGLYSEFEGNILAAASITMNTGATSCGRLLAGAFTAGAFVFDSNTVSVPGNGCPL